MKRTILLVVAAALIVGAAPTVATNENEVQVVINIPADSLPAGEWTTTNVWGYLHDGNPFTVEPVTDSRVMPFGIGDTSGAALVVSTVAYDKYTAKMERGDKDRKKTVRAIFQAGKRGNVIGFRNNYRLLIRQYDDVISWLKSVTADPCWENERTKAIQLLTAERNKFNQSFQQVQRGSWSAAGRSLKQAFKLRTRTVDWYNNSYAWACE
jgi:hypothetical protein